MQRMPILSDSDISGRSDSYNNVKSIDDFFLRKLAKFQIRENPSQPMQLGLVNLWRNLSNDFSCGL